MKRSSRKQPDAMGNIAKEPIDIALIKRTFVNAQQCVGDSAVACLASVVGHYGGNYSVPRLAEWAFMDGKRFATLGGIKHAAEQLDFMGSVKLMTMEQLMKVKLPKILLFKDQTGKVGFVVCYGIYEDRFVVGEPGFAFMQYLPCQMEEMWIEDIALDLYPEREFFER